MHTYTCTCWAGCVCVCVYNVNAHVNSNAKLSKGVFGFKVKTNWQRKSDDRTQIDRPAGFGLGSRFAQNVRVCWNMCICTGYRTCNVFISFIRCVRTFPGHRNKDGAHAALSLGLGQFSCYVEVSTTLRKHTGRNEWNKVRGGG